MLQSNNTNEYSSEMNLGFGYMQLQEEEPFKNFLKKIEVDDTNKKLSLSFSKFANQPIIIDFDSHKMTLPTSKEKDFKKFVTVTYEYAAEKKSIIIKTISYLKGKLQMGQREIKTDSKKQIKLTNITELDQNNYSKISRKILNNDNKYIIPIPDFYRSCFAS